MNLADIKKGNLTCVYVLNKECSFFFLKVTIEMYANTLLTRNIAIRRLHVHIQGAELWNEEEL